MQNQDMSREYRLYEEDNTVSEFYRENHRLQTFDFVRSMHIKYHSFDTIKMSVWDAVEKLDEVYDDSDPDTELKQSIHALQTAEALREAYPEKDWVHLVGFIHDLEKILMLPPFSEPSWCVVGDTFPVGCAFDEKVVYPHYFDDNPDGGNESFKTLCGIYERQCGLDNVLFSYGHDEYLYQVLKHNGCTLPETGMKMIRYHSFYSWHKENAYGHLTNLQDDKLKKWCRKFSECDLYSKSTTIPSENNLSYYKQLIAKYFPVSVLSW